MSPGRLGRGQEAGWRCFPGHRRYRRTVSGESKGWLGRVEAGGVSQSRGRARGSAPEGLKQQADGGPVCPPTCVCQRGTKMCLIITGPGFRLAAPLWSEAFSISLSGSSIDGSHQREDAIPSELVLLCTPAPEPRSQQGWAGIWATIRSGKG